MTANGGSAPPVDRGLRRIGLWGAPSSGKTTYLAALNVAVARAARDLTIIGVDDDSTEFLAENTDILTRQRTFPPATEATQPLSWALHMPVKRTVPGRFGKFSKPTVETVPFQLNLDLLDAPGRVFASVAGEGRPVNRAGLFEDDDDAVAASPEEDVIDHLAGCDGIVFLFDPIRERRAGDAYHFFQGTLLRIAQRRLGQGGPVNAKLPQYLAVCITKFDDPVIYRRAKVGGYRTFDPADPRMFPRVSDEKAAPFFEDLCRTSELGNADLVSAAIRQYFRPERVKYFITSAIGFHLGRATRFREQDYQNVVPDGGSDPGSATGEMRIRGAIHPINVVEPLLWLGEALAAEQS